MKPGLLYPFTDKKFVEQLEKAINGHAPWKDHKSSYVPKVSKWRSDPITDGQKNLLKNLGVKDFPKTKGEASDLITRMKQKA